MRTAMPNAGVAWNSSGSAPPPGPAGFMQDETKGTKGAR